MKSLEGRLGLLLFGSVLAVAATGWGAVLLGASGRDTALATSLVAAVVVALVWLWSRRSWRKATVAIDDAAARLADHDATSRIAWSRDDEIGRLLDAANHLAEVWSAERAALRQRDLILETVLDTSPVAALLVDRLGRVTYASRAARVMFAPIGRLTGRCLEEISGALPGDLGDALCDPAAEGILRLDSRDDEVVHLRRRRLVVHGAASTLILLERITAEVRRGELATWKRTTRLLCHELNNSLAPIASLSRSAAQLVAAGRLTAATDALAIVEERSAHLGRFIADYGALARLPAPRCENVDWGTFLAEAAILTGLRVTSEPPKRWASFDPVLVEQALINLAKNAREASSAEVELEVQDLGSQGFLVSVRDRGIGFSPQALEEGHLPFWTSKPNGTGLGLALVREVVEAHQGRLTLRNRPGGGAEVVLYLPGVGTTSSLSRQLAQMEGHPHRQGHPELEGEIRQVFGETPEVARERAVVGARPRPELGGEDELHPEESEHDVEQRHREAADAEISQPSLQGEGGRGEHQHRK